MIGVSLAKLVLYSSTLAQPVLNQDILVDLSGSEPSITVQAELQIDAPTRSVVMLRPFAPVLNPEFGGQPVTFRPHPQAPNFVDIAEVAQPVGPGPVLLSYVIAGTPVCTSAGQNGVSCVHNEDQTILTPAGANSAWYHVDLFGDGLFTGSVDVIATDQTVLSGQGPATEVTPQGDGTTRHRFHVNLPTPLLGLYAGRYPVDHVESPFSVRTHRGPVTPQDKLRSSGERGARAIDLMQGFLGSYPSSEANLVSVPSNFAFGGLGLFGTVFIQERIFSDFDYILHAGIAHEFAHTYWGHQASGQNEAAYFFSEGFAEYTAWRAVGLDEGPDARRDGSRLNSVWYMFARPNDVDSPIVHPDTPTSPAYVFVAYHKASSVLRMIEQRMGQDAFDAVLAELLAMGPGRLTVQSFRNLLTQHGLQELRFVDRWLLSSGYPVVEVETSTGSDLQVHVTVRGDFELGLPVEITDLSGATTTQTWSVRTGSQSFVLANASHIRIDPEWTHLREIQPLDYDVNFDGVLDAADLLDVALHVNTALPRARRQDGGYDPLYDLNQDRRVDVNDLDLIAP